MPQIICLRVHFQTGNVAWTHGASKIAQPPSKSWRTIFRLHSEKLEKAGTVDFKKHPARKVGTRSRECGPKVPGRLAFPGDPNPRIYSISRFGKNFPAIFPGLSRSFPGEPPNGPRKQPQPSRVFWYTRKPYTTKHVEGINDFVISSASIAFINDGYPDFLVFESFLVLVAQLLLF